MSRQEEIRNLYQVLIRRGDALRKALGSDLTSLREPCVKSDDDVTDSISQLAEIEARELSRVERALARMKEGLYGTCETCGETISMVRLNALPYANLCIRCQLKFERQVATAEKVDWSKVTDSSDDEPDLLIDDELEV